MISSAQRSLTILEAVGRSQRPVGVTELARELGYSVGTVFRGLDALETSGYVTRFQASSRYVLGPAVSRLHQSLLAKFALRGVSLPYMRQLAFATGECVSLTMRVGWYGLRLAAAPGTNEVTSSPPVGHLRTLHQTVSGRAILASMSWEKIGEYLDWTRGSGHHDAPAASFRDELAAIAEREFSTEATAFAANRAAISFAIQGPYGPLGAIAIEGPVFELDPGGDRESLSSWIAVVTSLQTAVDSQPGAFANPFQHITPGDIHLLPDN